jgi:DNA polymerase III epsilon subunit-like protein
MTDSDEKEEENDWIMAFDTETTGLPREVIRVKRQFLYPYYRDWSNYDSARVVSIAWLLYRPGDEVAVEQQHFIIKPTGFEIPETAVKIHGITTEKAQSEGHDIAKVLEILERDLARCNILVAHNIMFDVSVMKSEASRADHERLSLIDEFDRKSLQDTAVIARSKLTYFPKLGKLYELLFSEEMVGAHDALADAYACGRCYFELIKPT